MAKEKKETPRPPQPSPPLEAPADKSVLKVDYPLEDGAFLARFDNSNSIVARVVAVTAGCKVRLGEIINIYDYHISGDSLLVMRPKG